MNTLLCRSFYIKKFPDCPLLNPDLSLFWRMGVCSCGAFVPPIFFSVLLAQQMDCGQLRSSGAHLDFIPYCFGCSSDKQLHAGCSVLQQQPFDNRTFYWIKFCQHFFPLFHLLQLSPLQHSSSCVSLALSTSQMFSKKSLLCVLGMNACSNSLTAESVFWGLGLTSAFTARFKCVHIHHFLNKRLPSAFQEHMRLVLADDVLNTPRFFRNDLSSQRTKDSICPQGRDVLCSD